VSDEDAALFRDAAGDVRPLEDERAPVYRRRAKPHPRLPSRSEAVEESPATQGTSIRQGEREGEQLFVRAGLQKKNIRRLRRGQIPIEAEADLHGMRIREAQILLADFLRECRIEGARCVRVVHGKGLGSRGGHAVLKWEVDRWLRQHEGVMAFCTAQPRDGGTGAVYVLLKG
jgi:DNA-nicking Smr family endonuclease